MESRHLTNRNIHLLQITSFLSFNDNKYYNGNGCWDDEQAKMPLGVQSQHYQTLGSQVWIQDVPVRTKTLHITLDSCLMYFISDGFILSRNTSKTSQITEKQIFYLLLQALSRPNGIWNFHEQPEMPQVFRPCPTPQRIFSTHSNNRMGVLKGNINGFVTLYVHPVGYAVLDSYI